MAIDAENSLNISEQISRYLAVLREKWYFITVCAVIGVIIGVGVAQLWPDQFKSDTLFVLRESRLITDSTLENAMKKQKLGAKIKTMRKEVRSTARLKDVLKKLEWTEYITAQMLKKETEFYARVKDALMVEINDDLLGETMVTFEFLWNDPQKAQEFVAAMRDHWVSQKLEFYQKDDMERLDRMEVVLTERDKDYKEAMDKLEQFNSINNFASYGTIEDNNKMKADLKIRIADYEGDVNSTHALIAELENALAKLSPFEELPNKVGNPEYKAAYMAWKKAENAYNEKAVRMTEDNPKLIQCKIDMETAKAKLDGLDEYIVEGITTKQNVKYQITEGLLQEARIKFTTASEKLKLSKETLAEIERKIAKFPSLNAEREMLQAEVERARESRNETYTAVLPLRDRVKSFTTQNQRAGAWTIGSDFKNQFYEILQHATLASEPENSMTIMILSLALFIGLGLGLALSLMGEMLKTSFSTRTEVVLFLKKPVLGAVNRIITQGELRAMKFRKFISVSSSLLLIFALVAILYICNNHLDLIPQVIVDKVNEIREKLV